MFFFYFLCSFLAAQHQDKVDFTIANISITPLPVEKKIKGTVVYDFHILKNVDSVFLDAKNMHFSSVQLDGRKIFFYQR